MCRLGEELTPVEKAVGVLVDEELEDAQRLEHLCYGDRLRSWGVQHGEEKAAGRPHCGLPVLKRELTSRRETGFLHGQVVIGQGLIVLN